MTLALGTLGNGEIDALRQLRVHFAIVAVPEGESIYAFRGGNRVRGAMKYTRAELKAPGDVIALTFG